MARDTDDLKSRVQKLLNQAADREGTPEGDTFYEKAFDLMARYGFDERDLAAPGAGEDGMTSRAYEFSGSYTDMQMQLLNCISSGLHCVALGVRRPRATSITTGTVYGVARHVERVDLLFAILKPKMIALAMNLSEDLDDPLAASLVARRRSFMHGYSNAIFRRLKQAEARIEESQPGYGLALIDDAARAREYMDEMLAGSDGYVTNHRSRRKLDAAAFAAGGAEASRADLGQRRFGGRRAIDA
ncbi:hypothetical protein B841_06265 [Corynebacterium maris DSM 45190]|uniref:DUF2786 domain-containing protein n=1 Tax=Corynebacterium maris DSM 45190 TaxID=1224163 RepID=S5TIJ5_9CORY|nr:DUF2786 domain-containing protein [Corynebacterium maris]AGS34726.1 hypothetical protein B841_06265 [Corynebacterium maris DSM 45190]